MFNMSGGKIKRSASAILCALLLAAPLSNASAATIEYTVTATRVNIRKEASTSSSVLSVVRQGDTVKLISSDGDGWLKVQTSNGTGYLSADYACLTGFSGSGAEATVLVEKLNVRSTASTGGKVLAVPRRGSTLQVIGMADGWLKVSYNDKVGYVSPEYVSLNAGEAASATAAPTSVPTSAPTAAPEASVLKRGDRGSSVKELQQQLISLGYLTGRADGIFGSNTVAAVKAFQRDHSLMADGEAGASTLSALAAALATPEPTAAPTPIPTAAPEISVLKKGDRGDAVKALQQKLIALGYLSGRADGIFGSDTRDAVKTFQRNEGINDDGAAGRETLAALEAAYSAPSAPSAPESGSSGIVLNTSGLLKKGSRGDQVKALQEKLTALGYFSDEITGYFGSATRSAVRAFQRDKGLTVDGIAGTSTLAALSSVSDTAAPDNPTGSSLLKYGDTGEAVKQLQTRLKELGYFSGTVGGNFGAITRDAVQAFQTAAGLTNDGMAGEETLKLLFSADAPANKIVSLRVGDTGDAVTEMQNRLKELGYLTGSADGEFGVKTQAAVMAFQKAASLTADGVAGQSTLNALYSADAPKPPTTSDQDTADTSVVANKIIATAKKYLGCKYVYACEDPPYFDCSGLTQYVFKQYGYSLLRTAYQQGYNDQYQKLTMSQLKTGDLVFFNTNLTDSDQCDHTGIYIGGGDFIHASSSAGKVVINNLNSGYYNTRFSWGRRILTD